MYIYILPVYEYVLLYTYTYIKCVAQFNFFKVRSYMGKKAGWNDSMFRNNLCF